MTTDARPQQQTTPAPHITARRLAERMANIATHLERLAERGIDLDPQTRLEIEDAHMIATTALRNAGRAVDPYCVKYLTART